MEVVEYGPTRSLHFGNEPKQSSMDLAAPSRLLLSYTRAMVAGLLFTPTPRRVLMLGLGGGSLVRFFRHHFPDTRVDVVELRPQVVELAASYFFMERNDPKLRIITEDAANFIVTADAHFADYDLVLIDAFGESGIASSICNRQFMDACRQRLSEEAVVAINLWSSDFLPAEMLLEDLEQGFQRGVLRLPVEGKDNIIGIALPTNRPRKRLRGLDKEAKQMQGQHQIEYPAFLKTLRRANHWLF